MNKDQRKYLTDWVAGGFEREKKKLEAERYTEPSLNNYLVAAALDGSLVMKSAESLMAHIKQIVINLGSQDRLIKYESGGYNRPSKTLENAYCVTVRADELFEFPSGYLEKLEKWQENEKRIREAIANLEGVKTTVLLKVNIGSDKALEEVIAQADSLATLDIVNKKLTANTPKQIET